MREILFRGKRTDNGEWVYGSPIFQDAYVLIRFWNSEEFEYEEYLVAPESVSEFTGLTDKNGKKIFEGDILKQKTTSEFAKVNSFEWERYGIIRFGYCDWNEGEAGYASEGWYIEPLKSVSIKPKNYLVGDIQSGLNQCDIHDKYYPMEVIGNIYDTPELLEVKK